MIGYVIPASFLGGPEFGSFRRRVLQLAEVLVVDLIEKRSDVFLDAIQDACFVVLRRRAEALAEPPASVAASGVFRRDGKFVSKDVAHIEANGAPWRLPGVELVRSSTLKDWGYRATVGYLVANRQPERLHKRAAKGRYPLIWAKAITPEEPSTSNGVRPSKATVGLMRLRCALCGSHSMYGCSANFVARPEAEAQCGVHLKSFHQEARRRRCGKSRHPTRAKFARCGIT